MDIKRTSIPAKQLQETRLLASVRFACLMAMAYPNPMECQRVQKRVAELNNYLHYNQPSANFFHKYGQKIGLLGREFVLGICPKNNQAAVSRLSELPEHTQLAMSA